MSDRTRYVFRSVWTVEMSPDEAYEALHEVAAYPSWWKEVKEARELPGDRYRLRCRSSLPYDLVFTIERSKEDPAAGILEAQMEGDLEGFSRWTISARADGSSLLFEEDVRTNKRLLTVLAPVARPAFKRNHTIMMRNGERGLRAFLAGMRFARDGSAIGGGAGRSSPTPPG